MSDPQPQILPIENIPFPARTAATLEDMAVTHASLTRQANDIEAAMNLIIEAVQDSLGLDTTEWQFVNLKVGFTRQRPDVQESA